MSKGCDDVAKEVYDRVKSEGGSNLKASIYSNIARQNCETAGKGDPPDKKDKKG